MEAVALSTSTIITIGAVFLFIMILTVARRALSTILWGLLIAVVIVFLLQMITGYQLVDLMELLNWLLYKIMQFFYWVQDVFWPKLADAATDMGNTMG